LHKDISKTQSVYFNEKSENSSQELSNKKPDFDTRLEKLEIAEILKKNEVVEIAEKNIEQSALNSTKKVDNLAKENIENLNENNNYLQKNMDKLQESIDNLQYKNENLNEIMRQNPEIDNFEYFFHKII